MLDKFDEFDMNKLKKAKKLLVEVYEFNFGFPPTKSKVKRLETIINKLEQLLNA